MTMEDAMYYKILLLSGFSLDELYQKLDADLEEENPLSDVTLTLSTCNGNAAEILSCLNVYCRNNHVNQLAVCERLRKRIKDDYICGKINEKQAVEYLSLFAISSENTFQAPWSDMYDVANMYEMAEFTEIEAAVFTKQFLNYIDNGTPVNIAAILASAKKQPFFKRLSARVSAAIKKPREN